MAPDGARGAPSAASDEWTAPPDEVAACRRCNADRGHPGPIEWLDECRRRPDRSPQTAQLVTLLDELDAELDRTGGRRRARQYLTGQLRRLRSLER
ncbi:HNH endonuclease [Rhodococcus zopfii]|uniref:HNH endonuclease n=1 Tax=Rhodococcus zopfii TaxID=43772 RepID=UPI003657A692